MKSSDDTFDWSLKPLVIFFKFFGFPLNFSNSRPTNQPKIRILKIAVPIVFGLCLVTANLVVNGPRGIEIFRLKFMEDVKNFDSPYVYFKTNPFGIVKLVKIISEMIFFCYVPFIHVTFIASILFDRNWKKLVGIFKEIQNEMKLSEEFYRNCRRKCYMALFLLALVSADD